MSRSNERLSETTNALSRAYQMRKLTIRQDSCFAFCSAISVAPADIPIAILAPFCIFTFLILRYRQYPNARDFSQILGVSPRQIFFARITERNDFSVASIPFVRALFVPKQFALQCSPELPTTLHHERAHLLSSDWCAAVWLSFSLLFWMSGMVYLSYIFYEHYTTSNVDWDSYTYLLDENLTLLPIILLPVIFVLVIFFRLRHFIHEREFLADIVGVLNGKEEYLEFLDNQSVRDAYSVQKGYISKYTKKLYHPTFKERKTAISINADMLVYDICISGFILTFFTPYFILVTISRESYAQITLGAVGLLYLAWQFSFTLGILWVDHEKRFRSIQRIKISCSLILGILLSAPICGYAYVRFHGEEDAYNTIWVLANSEHTTALFLIAPVWLICISIACIAVYKICGRPRSMNVYPMVVIISACIFGNSANNTLWMYWRGTVEQDLGHEPEMFAVLVVIFIITVPNLFVVYMIRRFIEKRSR